MEAVNQLRDIDMGRRAQERNGIFRVWLVVDKACRTDLYHRR